MKIGIDISQIVYETGVSWYTRNLVRALLKADRGTEYLLFGGALRRFTDLDKFARELRGNFTKKFFPLSPTMLDFFWNRLHLFPIENFTGDIDVFHSSDWAQPPARRAKLVTTIHDLAPLRFPDITHPRIVSAHKARLAWVKKEVDKIMAVSQFTKKEMVELLGIKPEKIVVIPEAPDPIFKSVPGRLRAQVRRRYKLKNDYLLVVGTDPRKNLPAIVRAFANIGSNLDLVIAGREWAIPAESRIRILGHIPRKDMPALYSGASALVYTSLYEGFGLPILEAMASGCPVVTSNITSLPEVAGEAAVLVDPTNPTEIAAGIEKALAESKIWIKKGKERVKQFSWEKTARETLKVYRELVK